MMTELVAAHEALAAAEAAQEKAVADAAHARDEFEQHPSARTHNGAAIADQVARNSVAPVEAARGEIERIENEVIDAEEARALERAAHNKLFADVEPDLAELVELEARVRAVHAGIVAKVTAQRHAVDAAIDAARRRGRYSRAPSKIALTFLRAVAGIRIARRLYLAGATFELGAESWGFIAPRPEPPLNAPGPIVDEWRRARRIALAEHDFLPSPRVDYQREGADVHFFHTPPPVRPSRSEVG